MEFEQLFRRAEPQDIDYNIFTFTDKEFPAVTAGDSEHYNSMIGTVSGFGHFMKRPSVWCLFQTGRYTLDLIEQTGAYTLSYFPAELVEKAMFLGSKTGRDSEKMREVALTATATPAGNIAFAEAYLIIECELTYIADLNAGDFCSEYAREYLSEAYKDPNERRRLVLGEIINVYKHI